MARRWRHDTHIFVLYLLGELIPNLEVDFIGMEPSRYLIHGILPI